MTTIGIIGAGAWGTALAQSFARHGQDVILWARDPGLADTINTSRRNPLYLPDIPLNAMIRATGTLAQAAKADIVVPVVPAQYLRGVLAQASSDIRPGAPLVVCAKGIELETGKLMSQVTAETCPAALPAILSGPNFAHEIARGLPAAATLACADGEKIVAVRDALASRAFRLYLSTDMTGTQVGGAVKNVIAIACGIVVGRHMGENARAAVVTRALHEMARLAEALGGRRETLMGLSGMGDLLLTCSSMSSRNFSLGHALGSGKTLAAILKERHGVTEGIDTARAVITLARSKGVDMPLCAAVAHCLQDGYDIDTAIHALLDRPLQNEDA